MSQQRSRWYEAVVVPYRVEVRWNPHAVALTPAQVEARVRDALDVAFGSEAFTSVDALVMVDRPRPRMHGADCVCGCDEHLTGGGGDE